MLNFAAMMDRAGAIIVETRMRLKLVADKTFVTAHLRLMAHRLGLEASNGSSKATMIVPWCDVSGSAALASGNMETAWVSASVSVAGEVTAIAEIWSRLGATMLSLKSWAGEC